MSRQNHTEVLVVGAGPVGMLTALLLAESGIRVKIIDQESRTATHSYACALHPHTLKLLGQAGLAADVQKLGHPVDAIAFYEGKVRRAELKLSELLVGSPGVVVLPQSALEPPRRKTQPDRTRRSELELPLVGLEGGQQGSRCHDRQIHSDRQGLRRRAMGRGGR